MYILLFSYYVEVFSLRKISYMAKGSELIRNGSWVITRCCLCLVSGHDCHVHKANGDEEIGFRMSSWVLSKDYSSTSQHKSVPPYSTGISLLIPVGHFIIFTFWPSRNATYHFINVISWILSSPRESGSFHTLPLELKILSLGPKPCVLLVALMAELKLNFSLLPNF